AFARIAAELAELMRSKGYRRLDDFRGKLRTL
ncbi:dihydroorotate oxidase, partial [Chromobacterium piscinae]